MKQAVEQKQTQRHNGLHIPKQPGAASRKASHRP